MLFNEVSKGLIEAMKARDNVKKEVLSMLKSKMKAKAIEMRIDELDDSNALVVLQKFIKELEDEYTQFSAAGRDEKASELKAQLDVVKVYLPRMMSEEEIRAEIAKLEDKSMPSVMKHFKANFTGKVDMSLVSKIARG